MAPATTTIKTKTDRTVIYWVFGLGMLVFCGYLLLAKGGDLGQGDLQAKKEALAKKEEATRYAAKIANPAASSSAQFDAAQVAIKARVLEASRVAPPPMGPADIAGAMMPPPPDMNSSSNKLQLERLGRGNAAAGNSGGGTPAAAGPGFVVYEAGNDSKEARTPGSSPLNMVTPGYGVASPETGASTAVDALEATASTASDSNNPALQAAKQRLATAVAAQAAALKQKEESITAPEDENNAWLFSKQNEKVKNATPITATRNLGLYWIAPGTVISAVALNAVDTTIPGRMTARVTQTTYDSRYGRYAVIPAGSVLTGEYNTTVKDGQHRVQMAFDTLVTPAGGQVALGNMSASDALGRAGIEGTLHTHFFQRMGISTLMAFEAVGIDRLSKQTQVVAGSGQSGGPPPVSSGGQIIVEAANAQIKEMFALGPNITIREGSPMTIITTGGIEIPPIANTR